MELACAGAAAKKRVTVRRLQSESGQRVGIRISEEFEKTPERVAAESGIKVSFFRAFANGWVRAQWGRI